MNTYLIALELFMFAFAAYILLKKGELAIISLPVVFFCDTVTDSHYINAFVYYGIISVILIKLMVTNQDFLKYNKFGALLILYFFVLMTKAMNLAPVRSDVFNVMWFFISLPMVVSIYKKYPRSVIFKELANTCCIILGIFIVSVLFSTRYKFSPYEMYGITSGLMFGNIYATDFNIIGPAIFILLLWSLTKRNYLYLIVTITSLAFISLSMRRSVMGISVVGAGIVTFIYLSKNLKQIVPFVGGAFLVIFLIIAKTDFTASLNERYELRNLDERGLNEEQRYFEYQLLYEDVFHYKRYSPWTGFDLFNSPGNYGGGKFYDRSLHGDITSIGHSSGLIGLALYFSMIAAAFLIAYRAAKERNDKLLVLFGVITFVSYTLTGRFTQVDCMLMIFLVASLPVAQAEAAEEISEEELLEYGEPVQPGVLLPADHLNGRLLG